MHRRKGKGKKAPGSERRRKAFRPDGTSKNKPDYLKGEEFENTAEVSESFMTDDERSDTYAEQPRELHQGKRIRLSVRHPEPLSSQVFGIHRRGRQGQGQQIVLTLKRNPSSGKPLLQEQNPFSFLLTAPADFPGGRFCVE